MLFTQMGKENPMKLRKVLAGLLAGAMLLGSLSTGVMAYENPALDTSEEVELVMYVVSDRPAGQDVVDEHLNEILKEKLNCTLKLYWISWAEYANKYPLLFSSGESFDIAYAATWLNYFSLAQRGAFKALNDLWPTYAPENYARQSEGALQQAKVGEDYYCVPTLLATYNAYGPIYRTDVLEGTDWDGKMETFEDIETYCDYIKEYAPQMDPIDMYSAGPEFLYLYMQGKGYTWVSKSYPFLWFDPTEEHPHVFTTYEEEGIKGFLETMARFNEKGFFSKSALSDTDSAKPQNGKAALRVHNIDTYASWAAIHPEWGWKFSNFVADVAHLPFTQDCMVIPNTSKNPERAMALIELLTNDQEVYDALMYGVEGVTYTLNEKGEFAITDTDLYAEGSLWAARTNEFRRNQFGTPDDYNETRAAFEASIVPGQGAEKFAGFTLDTTPVETQLSTLVNVKQQYWWPLELAYTDVESGLSQYQTMCEIAGIEDVRVECERQLEEYLAGLE